MQTYAIHAAGSDSGKTAAIGPGFPVHTPEPLDVDGQLIHQNLTVNGRRTSLRLESVMWRALEEVANREGMDCAGLVGIIARRRSEQSTLTATVRAFLIAYLRAVVAAPQGGRLLDRGEAPEHGR